MKDLNEDYFLTVLWCSFRLELTLVLYTIFISIIMVTVENVSRFTVYQLKYICLKENK